MAAAATAVAAAFRPLSDAPLACSGDRVWLFQDHWACTTPYGCVHSRVDTRTTFITACRCHTTLTGRRRRRRWRLYNIRAWIGLNQTTEGLWVLYHATASAACIKSVTSITGAHAMHACFAALHSMQCPQREELTREGAEASSPQPIAISRASPSGLEEARALPRCVRQGVPAQPQRDNSRC